MAYRYEFSISHQQKHYMENKETTYSTHGQTQRLLQIQKIFMNKTLLIIGCFILALGYLFHVSAIQNEEIRAQAEQDKINQRITCMQIVQDAYDKDWDRDPLCDWATEECILPGFRADKHNATLQQEKNRCIELYK